MKKQKPLERGAGVLLPVSCLPSAYGIGTFGKAAYTFIDFLREAGQKYWQVLPLGPTSYGDSPYQSFSAFAGNPYFIDPELLIEDGLLEESEVSSYFWGDKPDCVDYSVLYKNRFSMLELAFSRTRVKNTGDYKDFCGQNAFWLEDYSLFTALKAHFGGKQWQSWPKPVRMAEASALTVYRKKLKKKIDFCKMCQYYFFMQWKRLKSYANEHGISIIGDIPIYVAMDSSDVWTHPELFQLDEGRNPTRVAGVPPDMFSETGQLWGNPLYDWDMMERTGYDWWKKRMTFSTKLYDVVRIDHFIGIAHYYSIPAEEDTATGGVWVQGPGKNLLEAVGSVIGSSRIIAEDLGVVTKKVVKLRKSVGYPGMKLMQFGFDNGGTNENLPGFFEKNSVIYGGTHDNETLKGFFAHQSRKDLRFAREYLNVKRNSKIPNAIIRAGYASCADVAVFQMQDYLGLGNEARINTPSTIGGNWLWRLLPDQLDANTSTMMKRLTTVYGR